MVQIVEKMNKIQKYSFDKIALATYSRTIGGYLRRNRLESVSILS